MLDRGGYTLLTPAASAGNDPGGANHLGRFWSAKRADTDAHHAMRPSLTVSCWLAPRPPRASASEGLGSCTAPVPRVADVALTATCPAGYPYPGYWVPTLVYPRRRRGKPVKPGTAIFRWPRTPVLGSRCASSNAAIGRGCRTWPATVGSRRSRRRPTGRSPGSYGRPSPASPRRTPTLTWQHPRKRVPDRTQVEIHQATAMVMTQLAIPADAALATLRAYAYAHAQQLDQVAHQVVTGQLRLPLDDP